MFRNIANAALTLTLTGLLLARLHMAFIRYFDVDEFAHMHWAYLISIGKLPYHDFFYYVIPVYQWLMTPLFLLRPDASVLIIVRVWEMFIYVGCLFLIFRIGTKTLNRHVGLLSAVIFSVFPMTFDKTIEVRPDILMIFFFLLATVIIIDTKTWHMKRALFVGCIIALDLLLLPKIIFALPSLLFLYFVHKPRPNITMTLWTLVGGIAPIAGFLIFLSLTGLLVPSMNAILHDSVAVNAGKIPFSPWKALSPYPLVYVSEGGPSFPWQVNSAIWGIAIIGVLITLIKRPVIGIFFTIFTIFGVLFLFAFPAPYTQYFMPLSAIAAITAACAVYAVRDSIRAIIRTSVGADFFYLILVILVLGVLVTSFKTQYAIRTAQGNTNDEQIKVINDLLKISKDTDSVYDMVGSYVFRPDAFYFCCHPYTEFIDRVSVKTPPLRLMLVKNQTRFIILDRTGQSLWLTPQEDLTFIKSHYLASVYPKIYTVGTKFTCTNKRCSQISMDNAVVRDLPDNTLSIFIADQYRITTEPPGRTIKLNGLSFPNGSALLTEKHYAVTVDPTLQGFTVQLDR